LGLEEACPDWRIRPVRQSRKELTCQYNTQNIRYEEYTSTATPIVAAWARLKFFGLGMVTAASMRNYPNQPQCFHIPKA
jgi:hypothetical protein